MRLTSLAGGPPHQGNPSARGELTLNNVAAGEYLLTASLPGYTTEERPVTLPFGAVVDLGDLVLRHDSDGGFPETGGGWSALGSPSRSVDPAENIDRTRPIVADWVLNYTHTQENGCP